MFIFYAFGDLPQPTTHPHREVCESLTYATCVYVCL